MHNGNRTAGERSAVSVAERRGARSPRAGNVLRRVFRAAQRTERDTSIRIPPADIRQPGNVRCVARVRLHIRVRDGTSSPARQGDNKTGRQPQISRSAHRARGILFRRMRQLFERAVPDAARRHSGREQGDCRIQHDAGSPRRRQGRRADPAHNHGRGNAPCRPQRILRQNVQRINRHAAQTSARSPRTGRFCVKSGIDKPTELLYTYHYEITLWIENSQNIIEIIRENILSLFLFYAISAIICYIMT